MLVNLNEGRASFCFIGKNAFSFSNLTIDINPDDLSTTEKEQLLYNLNRNILTTEDKEGWNKLKGTPSFEVSKEIPKQVVLPKLVDFDAAMEEDMKVLKKLLKENIFTIRKEASAFRVARLRRLSELERDGKNRKGLLKFFQECLDKHTSAVQERVGTAAVEPVDMVRLRELSTQLEDVVDSDEEEITIENL